MSRGTARRTVRVVPELWERAGRLACDRGESLSDIIRRALDAYVSETPPSPDTGGRASAAAASDAAAL
jgi:predicted DNA-binding protein